MSYLPSTSVALLLSFCFGLVFDNVFGSYRFSKSTSLLLKKRVVMQMFTNGMSESSSSDVYLSDVSPEAFAIMLDFMYSGEFSLEDTMDFGSLLLQLLLLADKFGITLLYQECCKTLLESLSEVVHLYLTKYSHPAIFCYYKQSCLLF